MLSLTSIVLSHAVHAVNVIIVDPNPIPMPLCPAPDILPIALLVAEVPFEVLLDGPVTCKMLEEWVCPFGLQYMHQFISTYGKKQTNHMADMSKLVNILTRPRSLRHKAYSSSIAGNIIL